MMLLGVLAIAVLGTFVFLALLGTVMGQAVGVISFLLYLVGAGILFTAGYFTTRLVFDLSEQQSMVIGAALPVTYGVGRLIWLKLGLPTPYSDYDRWRSQDHRNGMHLRHQPSTSAGTTRLGRSPAAPRSPSG